MKTPADISDFIIIITLIGRTICIVSTLNYVIQRHFLRWISSHSRGKEMNEEQHSVSSFQLL